MDTKKNKNLIAIEIGLAVIFIVIGIFYLKYRTQEKIIKQKSIEATKEDPLEKNSAKSISIADLKKKILNMDLMTIIDIRTPEEFKIEHLKNSKNIPFDEFEKYLPTLKKEYTYIFLDSTNTPGLLSLVGTYLPNNNFNNVSYLAGGFTEWKNGFSPTISAGNPDSMVDLAKLNLITSEEFKKIYVEQREKIFILDVRGRNRYNESHIAGAVNIYLDDIENKINEIPARKTTIIYDDDTVSAFKASVRLSDLGRTNYYSLSDGFLAWQEKGYPTEKTE